MVARQITGWTMLVFAGLAALFCCKTAFWHVLPGFEDNVYGGFAFIGGVAMTIIALSAGITLPGKAPQRDAIITCSVLMFACFVALLAISFIHDVLAVRREPSNQAMQLTASKPAVYAGGVCRGGRILRGMHSGLAAADLLAR